MARLASPDRETGALGSARSGCIRVPGTLRGAFAQNRSKIMLDILMLALAAGFFALAIGYTYACERL